MADLKVIIVDEKIHESVFRDTYTVAGICFGFWLIIQYMDAAIIPQILFAVLAVLVLAGKGKIRMKRMSPDEALKYLKARKPSKEGL